jgi:hypothetical protein
MEPDAVADKPAGGARKLDADAAIAIFLARGPGPRRDGTSTALSNQYNITTKAVRDVWNLRTWTMETMPHWTRNDWAKYKHLCSACKIIGVTSKASACAKCTAPPRRGRRPVLSTPRRASSSSDATGSGLTTASESMDSQWQQPPQHPVPQTRPLCSTFADNLADYSFPGPCLQPRERELDNAEGHSLFYGPRLPGYLAHTPATDFMSMSLMPMEAPAAEDSDMSEFDAPACVCNYWRLGTCAHGSSCRFSHTEERPAGGGAPPAAAAQAAARANIEINRQIVACEDPTELCALIQARVAEFNHVNVATAFRRLLQTRRQGVSRAAVDQALRQLEAAPCNMSAPVADAATRRAGQKPPPQCSAKPYPAEECFDLIPRVLDREWKLHKAWLEAPGCRGLGHVRV